MLPDIIGYNIEEGISLLLKSGFKIEDIHMIEYTSLKHQVLGEDARILKAAVQNGKVILTVSYF